MRLHQHQFFLGNFQMLNHQQNYFGMVFFSSFPQVTNGGQMRVIWGAPNYIEMTGTVSDSREK